MLFVTLQVNNLKSMGKYHALVPDTILGILLWDLGRVDQNQRWQTACLN